MREFARTGVLVLGVVVASVFGADGCASSCPRCEPVTQAGHAVTITSPVNNAAVEDRVLVEGRVSKECGQPWLIVHPLEVSSSWVQPRPIVDGEGKWRVNAYVGENGKQWGQQFELVAVACPSRALALGQVLEGVPSAGAVSQAILVRKAHVDSPSK